MKNKGVNPFIQSPTEFQWGFFSPLFFLTMNSWKHRLRASVTGEDIRIGLRGTAKLQGDWVVLGYYLMRRPLAKLREWTGL